MNDPESYVKYHRLQYRDNMRCLTENIGRWTGAGRECVDLEKMGNEENMMDEKYTRVSMNDVRNGNGKQDVCNSQPLLDVSSDQALLNCNGLVTKATTNGLATQNVSNGETPQNLANGQDTHDVSCGLAKLDVSNGGDSLSVCNDENSLDISKGQAVLDVIDNRRLHDVYNGQDSMDVCSKQSIYGRAIRVLDVGSGDGHFTSERLRQALPSHWQITGCDKSPAMVDHANKHHAGNGVQFVVMEIGKHIPEHYIGAFDHIFSFFCYHWIPNQRVAFSQTYDMLADGGDCLLLMVAHFPIVFDVYRWFSRSTKWSKWINDLDDLISPYHDCEDPAAKLRKYAEEAGFKDVHVKNTKSTYTYHSERDIKNMMTALNPFQIPKELMEEYLEEFVRVSKAEGHLSDCLTIHYSTNTLYARKY